MWPEIVGVHRALLLTLLVWFGSAATPAQELPAGYETLTSLGRRIRWSTKHLPVRLYCRQERFRDLSQYSCERWNEVARGFGLGNVLVLVNSLEASDLSLDFDGVGLPTGKAGAVWWDRNLNYVEAERVSVDGNWRVSEGILARVLLQELGHLLGLGDSQDPSDVMYTVVVNNRRRPLAREQARPSARDAQALGWLYRQPTFVPILGPRSARPEPSPGFRPQPAPAPSPGSRPEPGRPSGESTPSPLFTPIP